jgi:hypothetical protein
MEILGGVAIGLLLGVFISSITDRVSRATRASILSGQVVSEMDSNIREREYAA